MRAVLWSVLLAALAWAPGGSLAQAPRVAHAEFAHGIAPPPHRPPPGELRVWGHPQAAGWLSRQAQQFQRRNPGIRITPRLTGSDVGMAALYTGQADIVLMGREATESEVKAFEWVYRYRPMAVPILGGSLDRAGQSPALVVFVHRDNPVDALSLEQLDGIFGTAREAGWRDGQPVASAARGADRDIRRWGDLGLGGDWSRRAIRIYAPMAESGTGKFFRMRVLADSNRMHWDAITEFADPVGGPEDSGARILAALARDPSGIAISSLQFARPEVRPVRLVDGAAEAVAATSQSLAEGRYPLARTVYAYVNKPVDEAIDPQVLAWLRDVLEEAVPEPDADSAYLPLPEDRRRDVLQSLDAL